MGSVGRIDATASDGPDVTLRPLSVDDLDVHTAGCDALVDRWSNGGRTSTTDEHRAWLAHNAAAWVVGDDLIDVAVVDARTGEHVGVVGIQRRRPELEDGDVNLTYALYAGRRGRGYATAATRAAMDLARSREPVSRFVIRCDPANVASAAVARRLGFDDHGIVEEPDGERLHRFTCAPD